MPKSIGPHGYIRAQHHHVRSSDGLETMLALSRYPRDDRAVVETDRQLRAHRNPPRTTAHHANEIARSSAPQRHEIDEGGGAILGLDVGLEDECFFAIAARDTRVWAHS